MNDQPRRGGLTGKSDGTSCVLHGDEMVVYGGVVPKKVWMLDLNGFAWREQVCGGEVPGSRLYHSAVMFGGAMLVYGGELCGTAEADPNPYFELDMESYLWRCVPTHGDSPGHRSHHTATMCKGSMYIVGGKPTKNGRAAEQTVQTLARDDAGGFFSIFILEVTSRTWRRIERVDPIHPKVWGHSAIPFRHFIIIFGGFDVSQQNPGDPPGSPPTALLSDVVYTYNTESLSWSISTPHAPSPTPRGMHVSLPCLAEMLVFGGMTVDMNGASRVLNDAWMWDIATGAWRQLHFCIPSWESKRLLGLVHNTKLIICGGMGSCHILDLRDQTQGWTEVSCNASKLVRSSSAPRELPDISNIVPSDATSQRPSAQRTSSPPLPYPQDYGIMTARPPSPKRDHTDVTSLHQQLHEMQHQLSLLRSAQKSARPSPSRSPHEQEVQVLQEQLRQLQEQHKLMQTQHELRKVDIMEEIMKRKDDHLSSMMQQRNDLDRQHEMAKAEVARRRMQMREGMEMESVQRQRDAYERLLSSAPGHHPQLQAQQNMLQQQLEALAAQQEALRQQYQIALANQQQQQQQMQRSLSLEQVAATLAPKRYDKHGPSGEEKLKKYRAERERKKASSESQHEARRLKHLHGLQERLKEIESGLDLDMDDSPVRSEEYSKPSVSPAINPQVMTMPTTAPVQYPMPQEMYQQALYNVNPQLVHDMQAEHDRMVLEKLQQQQLRELQAAQQAQHRTTSPERRAPPLPTSDPAEWHMLKDMLGDNYAQIDAGDFPIGRLLSPPGSPVTSPMRRQKY